LTVELALDTEKRWAEWGLGGKEMDDEGLRDQIKPAFGNVS
jgi:hypothetical protein